MADPSWPAILPPPLAPGYGYAASSGAIETGMDSGFVLVRRRFTAHATIVPVTWRLNGNDKLSAFETFFWDTLQAGTLYFTSPLMNGMGINNVRAQFVHGDSGQEVYKPQLVSGSFDSWDVSATLRTYSMPVNHT